MILIVEDEPALAELVHNYLVHHGFEATVVADGSKVMNAFNELKPELVLLDLMLPHVDGLSLCKQIRAVSLVPIIMLTAKVEEIDRLLGLELGADDYICKPFSPREVVARVKAVLRRTEHNVTYALADTGEFKLNEELMSAEFQGRKLELTAVEFRLLGALYKRPERVLSREQLMNAMYPDERVVSDRTVDSHVNKIRRKLELISPDHELVQSVYGVGYRLSLPH